MKKINLLLAMLAAVVLGLGWGTVALAFHDGGVAHCDGCHTMHNSEDGQSIIEGGTVGTAGDHLTLGADPSSTCLNCHQGSGSYHIFSNDGSSYKPGGDFYWMTKEFVYVTHGTHTQKASNHGHNVIAADFGLAQDDTLTQAPGGTFQSAWLACSSCHDPHGGKIDKTGPIEASGSYGADPTTVQTGNFRLLGDAGYKAGPGFTFFNRPPIGTTSNNSETDSNHTDYGKGMSEWCANCHTGFLAASVGDHRHPASNTSTLAAGGLADNYNAYVKTGDLTGGAGATAYLALVPFERQITDPTQLSPSTTQGPNGSSNVMCLTCHRAHASAFPNSGRWDFETEFPAVDSHPKDTDGGATPGDELNSYYGRDMVALFGEGQRSFCNKCHVKD
jgi:5-methylcytosine-specific restriction endonuclease McrA